MAAKVSRTRTVAAAGVVLAFTLVGIACMLVAFYLSFLALAFNGGAARPGYLVATVLVGLVALGLAFGGHVLAEHIRRAG